MICHTAHPPHHPAAACFPGCKLLLSAGLRRHGVLHLLAMTSRLSCCTQSLCRHHGKRARTPIARRHAPPANSRDEIMRSASRHVLAPIMSRTAVRTPSSKFGEIDGYARPCLAELLTFISPDFGAGFPVACMTNSPEIIHSEAPCGCRPRGRRRQSCC